jgi:hypothetical protein
MPREYGKVSHRFWTGETGKEIRSLGLEARVVATYLLTCGSSTMTGLYYLPLTLLSHETGIPFEGALKALRRLSEGGFALYDENDEIVFVPNMAKQQIADRLSENDKQRKGVIALLKEFEKSKFIADFVEIYGSRYHLEMSMFPGAPSKPLPSPSEAPPKPVEQRAVDQGTVEQRTERETGARERDPSATATQLVPVGQAIPVLVPSPPSNAPGKPEPRNVVVKYLAIRAAEIVGQVNGANGLSPSPSDSDVQKAAIWIAGMRADECSDIEPAIRLACQHVKRGDDGWNKTEMTKVGFLFGSIVRNWPDLREELHGCAPKPRSGKAVYRFGRHDPEPERTPILER